MKTSLSFNEDGSINVMRHVGELDVLFCSDEVFSEYEAQHYFSIALTKQEFEDIKNNEPIVYPLTTN